MSGKRVYQAQPEAFPSWCWRRRQIKECLRFLSGKVGFFCVRRTISRPRWVVVAGCVSERVRLFFRSAGIYHRSILPTRSPRGLARPDQRSLDGEPVLGARNHICVFFRLHRLPSRQEQFEFICVASSCTACRVKLNFMAVPIWFKLASILRLWLRGRLSIPATGDRAVLCCRGVLIWGAYRFCSLNIEAGSRLCLIIPLADSPRMATTPDKSRYRIFVFVLISTCPVTALIVHLMSVGDVRV